MADEDAAAVADRSLCRVAQRSIWWAIFIGVVTFGIVPLIFMGVAGQRRRLIRFFKDGTPGLAEVLAFGQESTALGQELTRVSYQFSTEGRLHRDSDLILPVVAAMWIAGDQVHVLYVSAICRRQISIVRSSVRVDGAHDAAYWYVMLRSLIGACCRVRSLSGQCVAYHCAPAQPTGAGSAATSGSRVAAIHGSWSATAC